jgi:hypothetical protein
VSRPALPRDPARVAAWFRSAKTPASLVGERSRAEACPLARYLRAQGAAYASVHARYATSPTAPSRRLPPWAQWFRSLIDSSGLPGTPVSATEALTLLHVAMQQASRATRTGAPRGPA